jgi:hypothetical protein
MATSAPPAATAPIAPPKQPLTLSEVLTKAARGGFSGAAAMTVQVGTLMWLRTTMNYQYRCAARVCCLWWCWWGCRGFFFFFFFFFVFFFF